MKIKYIKQAAKEYGKDVLSMMKWFIPASAGIIVLGALALEAEDETEKAPVEEQTNEEASPNEEEQTKEEIPVEESNEEVQVTEQCGDENLRGLEKGLKEE